jgi:hypothetical protein
MIYDSLGAELHRVCRTGYADLPVAARQLGWEWQRSARPGQFLAEGIADRCGPTAGISGSGGVNTAPIPAIGGAIEPQGSNRLSRTDRSSHIPLATIELRESRCQR